MPCGGLPTEMPAASRFCYCVMNTCVPSLRCLSGTSDRLLACQEGWWLISTYRSNEQNIVHGTSKDTSMWDARCNAKLGEDKWSRGSGGPGVKSRNVMRLNAIRGLPHSLEADVPTVPLCHTTCRQQVSLHMARAGGAQKLRFHRTERLFHTCCQN